MFMSLIILLLYYFQSRLVVLWHNANYRSIISQVYHYSKPAKIHKSQNLSGRVYINWQTSKSLTSCVQNGKTHSYTKASLMHDTAF